MLRLSVQLIPDQGCRDKNAGMKYRVFNIGITDSKVKEAIELYEKLVQQAREVESDAWRDS